MNTRLVNFNSCWDNKSWKDQFSHYNNFHISQLTFHLIWKTSLDISISEMGILLMKSVLATCWSPALLVCVLCRVRAQSDCSQPAECQWQTSYSKFRQLHICSAKTLFLCHILNYRPTHSLKYEHCILISGAS